MGKGVSIHSTSRFSLNAIVADCGSAAHYKPGPTEGVIVRWINTEVNRSDSYYYIITPADPDLREPVLASLRLGKGIPYTTINGLINYPGKDTEAVLESLKGHGQEAVRRSGSQKRFAEAVRRSGSQKRFAEAVRRSAAQVLKLLREKSR